LISADGKISSQSQKLSDFGVSPGTFSINGVEIVLADTDTIQDLRAKINKAVDVNGKPTGVTATVLKISDTNYRLVLTNSETGSTGAQYKDLLDGTVLQSLGIIKNAVGDKGIVKQTLQSADNLKIAFDTLADNSSISFSGTDPNGKAVTGSFVKTTGSTIQDLTAAMANTFHGLVSVSVNDIDGTMAVTDGIGGTSKLAITSFTMGAGSYTFSMTNTGQSDATVLSLGKDAYYELDGLNLKSIKNSASGAVSGVTLNFHKVSYEETVSIKLERDYDGIIKTINTMTNSYNALDRYVNSSTKYGTKNKDGSVATKGGDLAGDSTIRSILSQFREEFHRNLDITGIKKYSSLADIGMKTNTKSGELETDATALRSALENNFDDVVSMFVTKRFTNNPKISIGTYGSDTEDGIYSLTEEPDLTQYRIQRTTPASPDTYLSDIRQEDVLSFSTGPTKGLFITAPAGSGAATFTFSNGLAGHLDSLVNKLTNSTDGIVALRQKSLGDQKSRIEERVIILKGKVEQYQTRLIRQFATMEQTLNQLNSQSSNMLSQLGYTKKS
jgi:flagellar capping protein FliD